MRSVDFGTDSFVRHVCVFVDVNMDGVMDLMTAGQDDSMPEAIRLFIQHPDTGNFT